MNPVYKTHVQDSGMPGLEWVIIVPGLRETWAEHFKDTQVILGMIPFDKKMG